MHAGCGEMNFSQENGWYFISADDRAPAWTGVEFLRQFLLTNRGAGVYGTLTELSGLAAGDIIIGAVAAYILKIIKAGISGVCPLESIPYRSIAVIIYIYQHFNTLSAFILTLLYYYMLAVQDIGGDCTNFVSQSLYAGCGEMNFSQENGWYFISADDQNMYSLCLCVTIV